MQPSSNKSVIFLLILVLILVLATTTLTALLFLGKTTNLTAPLRTSDSTGLSFFDNANGMVNGKIVAVDNNMLTIENSRGERQTFPASLGLTIVGVSDQVPGTKVDLSQIELDKDSLISLISNNGVLEVSSITPTTDSPPPQVAPDGPPPAATNSAGQAPPVAPAAPLAPDEE